MARAGYVGRHEKGGGMLEEFVGLPTHVLIIHAAVVFVPLASMAAVLYAVVPRWRWALRWPTVVLAGVGWVAAGMAVLTGLAFFDRLGEPDFVAEHRDRGLLLLVFVSILFGVVLAAAFILGGPTRLSGASDRAGAVRPVQAVTMVVVVLVAIATGVQAVRTGDEGSRAVWGTASASDTGSASNTASASELGSPHSSDVRELSSLR